ncbi:MAG: DUF4920 domain-containing protein [Flavobacteriales bacterium]|nr:DUF4920 domain-containing protein [Flavobacteriales bacterium]
MFALVACQSGAEKSGAESTDTTAAVQEEVPILALAYFGSEITDEGAIEVNEAPVQLGEMDSVDLKVVGRIEKVCQVKGCWMTMGYGEGESMHVSFRDYGFFVPKNIDGKDAVIDGTLYMETTSIEDLKHYAEDEGLTEDEIAMITEPETRLTFVADGVIVKDYNVEVGSADEDEQNIEEEEHDHSDHD